jgi:Xaa-Pro dipeptidase
MISAIIAKLSNSLNIPLYFIEMSAYANAWGAAIGGNSVKQGIQEIQKHLKECNLDGWLFYDFHARDALARTFLEVPQGKFISRRWFYLIPAQGEPVALVHRIESAALADLPGKKVLYAGWKELEAALKSICKAGTSVAMHYSPQAAIPSVSLVDGGTIDLIRACGVNVVSAADLIARFITTLSEAQIESYKEAGVKVHQVLAAAFDLIRSRPVGTLSEYEVQQFILEGFSKAALLVEGDPIVAVNEHAADPHFQVEKRGSTSLRAGDRVLIDLWAKCEKPDAVFYDITWCAYLGKTPPPEYREIFKVVVTARDKARDFISQQLGAHSCVRGYEVDEVCRGVVTQAGYGDYFTHRTGHSIYTSVHGEGANIDNFETHDDREIIPHTLFSIEPGIYKSPLGVRSEINILITADHKAVSFGPEQQELLCL